MNVVHVMPNNDVVEHTETADCVCGPDTEAVFQDDGTNGWLITTPQPRRPGTTGGQSMSDSEEKRKCVVCHRRELDATQLQTCVDCVGKTRNDVMHSVETFALLPAELVDHAGTSSPPDRVGSRSDNDGLPEALVLLAGGARGVNSTATGNREHAADQWPSDPFSVVGTLASWEDEFRETRGVGPARHEATVVGAAGYLLDNLSWAAQHHPAFDEFAGDMRNLRGQLEQVTKSADVVERGVECPECGTQLVRNYREAEECNHGPRPRYQKWYGMGYDLDIYLGLLEQWEKRHSYCDQGGRPDEWRCLNRECKRRVFTEREYYMAVWANWAHSEGQDVESKRDTISGHDGYGDGHAYRRTTYRLQDPSVGRMDDEAC